MSGERQLPLLNELLRHLAQAFGTTALYAPDHPRVLNNLPAILDPLQQLLAATPELTLVVVNDDLLFHGRPLAQTPYTARVARTLGALGIGHIKFFPGIDAADLRQLLRCTGGGDLAVLRGGHSKIRVGGIDVSDPSESTDETQIESFDQLNSTQLAGLQALYADIGSQQRLDARQLLNLVAGFIAAFRREANPLLALVPLRKLDDYTFTHSINVGILNIAQGMALGIEGQLLHDLGIAGMLHDAGKIFVDREIIQKPGKLTDEEWAIMRSHPSRGAQYLMNQPVVPTLAVISAYEHHMRYDLQGYPSPGSGWSLSLASQMTMISDTFDALRTRRIYKDPWDFPKVSGHMLSLAGSQLNADLVVNFLKVLAEMGEELPPLPPDDTVPSRQCYCE